MRRKTKRFLKKIKHFRFHREIEAAQWISEGCKSPAPHPIKMSIVNAYLQTYPVSKFIETGTFLGDTLDFISKSGIDCISIELGDDLFNRACQRFSGRDNVRLLHGDSGELIGDVLSELKEPALFWLDGHYSGGITAQGTIDTPISQELSAVLGHSIRSHVILIDDARCFDGVNGYPNLVDLLQELDREEDYSWEVSCDIVRITPRISSEESTLD